MKGVRTGLSVGLFILLSVLARALDKSRVADTLHPSAQHLATINVLIRDYANLPARDLATAADEISRIFAADGINVTWASDNHPAPRRGQMQLVINVETRSMASRIKMDDGVVGFTLPCRVKQRTCYAYIFYYKLANAGPEISQPKLLAYVAAHEIGHSVLDRADHSKSGIMLAQWRHEQLLDARRKRLQFTEAEVQAMHSRLLSP